MHADSETLDQEFTLTAVFQELYYVLTNIPMPERINLLSYILASLQLISHIEQFLDTNETLYFMKSMDCIKAFREEAIQVSVLTRLPAADGRGTQRPTGKPSLWKASFSRSIV